MSISILVICSHVPEQLILAEKRIFMKSSFLKKEKYYVDTNVDVYSKNNVQATAV